MTGLDVKRVGFDRCIWHIVVEWMRNLVIALVLTKIGLEHLCNSYWLFLALNVYFFL